MTGGNGNDTLNGNAGNDTLVGESGDDLIAAGSVVNGGVATTAYYERLVGDSAFGSNGAASADTFALATPTLANKAISNGSGGSVFNAGAMIADFNTTSDVIRLSGSMVGDGDNVLEGEVEDVAIGGPGFATSAEIVFFRTDSTASMAELFSFGVMKVFDAAAVLAVIDDAAGNYALGDKRLFVIDDGDASAVFQFVAANADAVVTVDELFLVAVVDANFSPMTGLTASDFVLG
jgi:hypothetical protein